MGIATVIGSVVGALSSPTAIATSTLLTGANTVMNAVELKNDSDIKAGISTANSRLSDIQNQLDEIQAISESGANKTDVKALFAAIQQPPQIQPEPPVQQAPPAQVPQVQPPVQNVVPPVQTVQQAVPQQIPVQQPQPEDMPEWAKAIIEQQNIIMANQNNNNAVTPQAGGNTTVNVNPVNPPADATGGAASQAPASIDEKLDKLIGVVGVMVSSINQLTNQTPAPADPATPAPTSEPQPTGTGTGK